LAKAIDAIKPLPRHFQDFIAGIVTQRNVRRIELRFCLRENEGDDRG
jgi:hypothetical protein